MNKRRFYQWDARRAQNEGDRGMDAAALRQICVGRHYDLDTGWRRTKPRMSKTIPMMARGPAAIEGIRAVLIPFARSDGLGVEEDVAIASNDQIMPRTVATRHSAAKPSAAAPAQSIHRVARVCGVVVDAVVDS